MTATTTKLAPAQALLLRTAARRPDGRVIPPDTLRGCARAKVVTALLQRGWIEPADGGHTLTDAGYAAIGQQRPVPPNDVQPMDANNDLQRLEGIPVRPGTKLAALVMALRRPQGATSLEPGVTVANFIFLSGESRCNPSPALSFIPGRFRAPGVQTCKPGTYPGSHLHHSPTARTRPR